jgi:hypothetical protein
MTKHIVVIHDGPVVPLPVQAMVNAFARQPGLLSRSLGLQDLREAMFYVPVLIWETSHLLFFDVPPWDVEASTHSLLSAHARLGWVFSAQFSAKNVSALVAWRAEDNTPAWSEPGCAVFDQAPGLLSIVLPPLTIADPSPCNPVRRSATPRICLATPPVSDRKARELQREYLLNSCERFQLSMLWPAEDMRELCERFYSYNVFFVPGEEGRAQWCFDLSCQLCAGAVVAGCVPASARQFCQPAGSLDEAAQASDPAAERTLGYNPGVMNSMRQDFMRTLVEGGFLDAMNLGGFQA